jgi:hypothetical protein
MAPIYPPLHVLMHQAPEQQKSCRGQALIRRYHRTGDGDEQLVSLKTLLNKRFSAHLKKPHQRDFLKSSQ